MNKTLTVYVPTNGNSFKIETTPLYEKVKNTNANANLDSLMKKYIGEYPRVAYMFQEKMRYAYNYGCDELIIDSKGDIFSNIQFLNTIFEINDRNLTSRFDYIAIKTAGEGLNDKTLKYLKDQHVREIVLKLTSHDDIKNANLLVKGDKCRFDIKELCRKIKDQGFLLRIQFYLTKWFDFVTRNYLQEYCDALSNQKFIFKPVEDKKEFKDYQINTIDDFTRIVNSLEQIGTTNSGLSIRALTDNVSLVYDKRTNFYNDNHLYLFPDGHLYKDKTKCNSLIY